MVEIAPIDHKKQINTNLTYNMFIIFLYKFDFKLKQNRNKFNQI